MKMGLDQRLIGKKGAFHCSRCHRLVSDLGLKSGMSFTCEMAAPLAGGARQVSTSTSFSIAIHAHVHTVVERYAWLTVVCF